MNDADAYILKHKMKPHPEGGYYKRLHTSLFLFASHHERKASSSVLYLLKPKQKSLFHRIDAEEVWYHDAGCEMLLVLLYPDGSSEDFIIGDAGEKSICVSPGTWMAARPHIYNEFSSVICHVTPEFNFDGFQMAERTALLTRYPDKKDLIICYTNPSV